jgi:SAM-dependent methyltransferase/Flp pilus assembly protein TadD
MNRKQRRAIRAPDRKATSIQAASAPKSDPLRDAALALLRAGQLVEAENAYRALLSQDPHHAETLHHLGVIACELGRHEAAIDLIGKALATDERNAEAHRNLGLVYHRAGDQELALRQFMRALELKPGYADAQASVAHLYRTLGHFPSTADLERLKSIAITALSSADPSLFRELTISLINRTAGVADCSARAQAAWPARLTPADLFDADGLDIICRDALLRTLLESTYIPDVGLERFLTAVRRAMLELAASTFRTGDVKAEVLEFHCALASQCFINEYIYDLPDDERSLAHLMREALATTLASGDPVPPAWLPAVAAYFPLHDVPGAAALLDRSWPAPVGALLDLQLRHPLEERSLAAGIPRLTAVDNDVSLLVQQQYEQNPYPRWIKLPPLPEPKTPDAWLRTTFPAEHFPALTGKSHFDMLIAGCGTGRHSIGSGGVMKDTVVLAVDLSLASLCYAKRWTRALGFSHIEYAQADILKLGSIGRTFDIIESVGVLHHLGEPLEGWRVLLSLLRPGGLMRLGFYSELARRHVVAIRTLIAERGYGRSVDDIRRCRQELLSREDDLSRNAIFFNDFFSTSECRDLLFHVQEHRFTLPRIKAFLSENDLRFMGFVFANNVSKRYGELFPAGPLRGDLDAWDAFERENPDAFAGMYQFWIQKPPF